MTNVPMIKPVDYVFTKPTVDCPDKPIIKPEDDILGSVFGKPEAPNAPTVDCPDMPTIKPEEEEYLVGYHVLPEAPNAPTVDCPDMLTIKPEEEYLVGYHVLPEAPNAPTADCPDAPTIEVEDDYELVYKEVKENYSNKKFLSNLLAFLSGGAVGLAAKNGNKLREWINELLSKQQ